MRLALASVAFWAPCCPDWPALRGAFLGDAASVDTTAPLPLTSLLGAADRRRAPDSVLLALHVAQQAVRAAGADGSRLASVFASPHGDLGITHEICSTLANDPSALSPTRFIHSVHNTVSGYWGIATGSLAASIAVAAHRCTFAAALLEAASQVACSGEPALLVAYETEPRGATAQLTATEGRMAVALVLAPAPGQDAGPPASEGTRLEGDWVMDLGVVPGPGQRITNASGRGGLDLPSSLSSLRRNDLADALPWLQAVATTSPGASSVLALPMEAGIADGSSESCVLNIRIQGLLHA